MKRIVVIGSMNMDTVVETARMPLPGETLAGKSVARIPGGKGANQAYTIGRLGGCVEMIGAVGDDGLGQVLTQNLKAAGVGTSGIAEIGGVPTGQTFITVTDTGENSILYLCGTNGCVDEALLAANRETILSADIVMLQFEIPIPAVRAAREMLRGTDILLIVDPAPASPDLPDSFYDGVDYMKPNETELQILTGMPVRNRIEAEVAARVFLAKGVRNMLVSLGASGCLLVNESGSRFFEAHRVQAVDTTAAGDSFVGAFAFALSRGDMPEDAVQFGQKVSSIVVTRKGAQTSIPALEEVMRAEW